MTTTTATETLTSAQSAALSKALADIDAVIAGQRKAFARGMPVPVSTRENVSVSMDARIAASLVGRGLARWHRSMEGHVFLTAAGIERGEPTE